MHKLAPFFLIVAFAGVAHAQSTLLIDTFNRGTSMNPSALNGSTATVDPSGNTYSVSLSTNSTLTPMGDTGSATTNGTQETLTAAAYGGLEANIEIASTISANTTYTFTLNMPTFTSNGHDNWLDIGLANDIHGLNSSIGGLFIRGAGSAAFTYGDGQFGNNAPAANVDTALGTQMTVTLDTGTGIENFYIGSLVATGTPTYTLTGQNPSGQYGLWIDAAIFNGDTNGTGNSPDIADATFPVSEVSVSSVSDTPEPSTWAMLIAGVALLGFIVRRRSFQS